MNPEVFDLRQVLGKQAALCFFGQAQFKFEFLSLLNVLDHLHAFKNIAGLHGQFADDLLIQARQRMHPLRTVEVKNSKNRGTIRLGWDPHQRQARHRTEVHRHNTGLLFVLVAEALDHENRCALCGHVIDDRVACLKVRQRQRTAVTIHSCGISESVSLTYEDESAFSPTDFQSRFQNLLERGLGSKELFPLILKIENA